MGVGKQCFQISSISFERWCKALKHVAFDSFLEDLPPLDVIMVWHAYLLNPGYEDRYNHKDAFTHHSVPSSWYSEDTYRLSILRQLFDWNDVFLTSLVRFAHI